MKRTISALALTLLTTTLIGCAWADEAVGLVFKKVTFLDQFFDVVTVVRDGVGVVNSTMVVFAILEEPISFYDFPSLFRDELGYSNALHQEGNVSLFYAPNWTRHSKAACLP